MTSKQSKWNWTEQYQKNFDRMKDTLNREMLLSYPDFNKVFEIYTDTNHLQLGAVISQKGKSIAFYSRKLNPVQTRYTTTEKEFLSIIETLKEFRNILLDHKIKIYIDYKNLTYTKHNTEKMIR